MLTGKGQQVDETKEIISSDRLQEIMDAQAEGKTPEQKKGTQPEFPVEKDAPEEEFEGEEPEEDDTEEGEEEPEEEDEGEEGESAEEKAADSPETVTAPSIAEELEELSDEQADAFDAQFKEELTVSLDKVTQAWAPGYQSIVSDINKCKKVILSLTHEEDPDDPKKLTPRLDSLTPAETMRLQKANRLLEDLEGDANEYAKKYEEARLNVNGQVFVKHNLIAYPSLKPMEKAFRAMVARGEVVSDPQKMFAMVKVEHERINGKGSAKGLKAPTKAEIKNAALEKHLERGKLGVVTTGKSKGAAASAAGKSREKTPAGATKPRNETERYARDTIRGMLKGDVIH